MCPPGVAPVMGMRADLMGRLRLLVQTEGWTQAQAAERIGIAQYRVSDLLRGKWGQLQPGHAHHPGGQSGALRSYTASSTQGVSASTRCDTHAPLATN